MVTAIVYTTKDIIKSVLSALKNKNVAENFFGIGDTTYGDPNGQSVNYAQAIQFRIANGRLCNLLCGTYEHVDSEPGPLESINVYQNLLTGEIRLEFGEKGCIYDTILLREYVVLLVKKEEEAEE